MELFDKCFEDIVRDLTESKETPALAEALQWFREVLRYNVPFGKKARGVSVVESYQILVPNAFAEDVKLAMILGWCVEMLQAYFLVADDIMDQSHTRRGQPCWFRKENIGLIAINDGIYIENAIFCLLKKYFKGKPYYIDIMELFHDINLKTITGQCMDMLSSPPNTPLDFDRFTEDRYDAIVTHKTAYYSFYLPVALAMLMAGISNESDHNNAKTILLAMGHFFQVQDDYLDCYGDEKVLGKIGTDIQDRKCGWLIVRALKLCDEKQRKILQENYGVDEKQSIQRVKEIYNQLNMAEIYRVYEEDSAKRIQSLIDKSRGDLPASIFMNFFAKIFKRQK